MVARLLRIPLCVALLLGAIVACAPGRDLPFLPYSPPTEYRLDAGDLVRLITFGEEALTGEFRVSDNGTVSLPLIGSVRAAGLTPRAFEAAVAEALRRGSVLRNPSVSAEVIAYRPIYVLGEVNKPGQYPYQLGMTVVTAAAVAGGFTYRAVEAYAGVVRTTDGQAIEGKAQRQAFIRPGDVITVYERRF